MRNRPLSCPGHAFSARSAASHSRAQAVASQRGVAEAQLDVRSAGDGEWEQRGGGLARGYGGGASSKYGSLHACAWP
jgi:hypothetical protein